MVRNSFFIRIAITAFVVFSKISATTHLKYESGLESFIFLNERDVLENFFLTLIKDTPFGYVLLGNKPTYFWTFSDAKTIPPCDVAERKSSTFIREGIKVIEKHQLIEKNSPYILKTWDTRDASDTYSTLLFIHRKKFLNIVQENLHLFQYILGPACTPELLLNKLMDRAETLSSVLKDNTVLLGIILGYGTENALLYYRLEKARAALGRIRPPFAIKEDRKKIWKLEKCIFPRISREETLEPSFGYKSLEEEFIAINAQMSVSSASLQKKTPLFIFARRNDVASEEQRIAELEKIQAKIRSVYQAKNFYEQILDNLKVDHSLRKDIESNNITVEESPLSFSKVVGKLLAWQLKAKDSPLQESFIQGMKDADQSKPPKPFVKKKQSLSFYSLEDRLNVQKNFRRSQHFFHDLKLGGKEKCIIPERLYIRSLRHGKGRELTSLGIVTVEYEIKDLIGDEIVKEKHTIDLSETILGFQYGMIGMSEGEIREVYIHPSLIYPLPMIQAKGWIAQIKLIEIKQAAPDKPLSIPIGNDFLEDDVSKKPEGEECYEQLKNEAYQDGYMAWLHYKSHSLFEAVVHKMRTCLQEEKHLNEAGIGFLSPEEEDTLSKLDCFLYQTRRD